MLAVKEMRKNQRLKDLAFIAQVCVGTHLTAALRSTNGQVNGVAIKQAEMTAKAVILHALPAISEAMGAELDTLLTHNVACSRRSTSRSARRRNRRVATPP